PAVMPISRASSLSYQLGISSTTGAISAGTRARSSASSFASFAASTSRSSTRPAISSLGHADDLSLPRNHVDDVVLGSRILRYERELLDAALSQLPSDFLEDAIGRVHLSAPPFDTLPWNRSCKMAASDSRDEGSSCMCKRPMGFAG